MAIDYRCDRCDDKGTSPDFLAKMRYVDLRGEELEARNGNWPDLCERCRREVLNYARYGYAQPVYPALTTEAAPTVTPAEAGPTTGLGTDSTLPVTDDDIPF